MPSPLKGQPGQRTPLDVRIRRLSKQDENGCWVWQSCIAPTGYGVIQIRTGIGRSTRVNKQAHRISYETFIGPIPEGLHLDHLCRTRACVNPQHLEPVTCRENVLRGVGTSAQNSRKTACHRGHELSGENLRVSRGTRSCRTCERANQLAWRAANRDATNARAREKARLKRETARASA